MNACVRAVHSTPIDTNAYRRAMGCFATGVAIVTAGGASRVLGMTVNSLTSVSLDPPLLLVCPRRGSTTGQAIKETGAFGVNILAEDQAGWASRFVGSVGERFEGIEHHVSARGLPLLADALAHFECVVHAIHGGGDHDIVVGEVVSFAKRDGDPLVFYAGRFGGYAPAF